jgi:hypothetical protein
MALKSFEEFGNIVNKVAQSNAVIYQRNMSEIVGGEVARLTPVDTGRATANWTGSINQPDLRPIKKYDTSAGANPTKRLIANSIKGVQRGDVVYISNGVQGQDDSGAFNGEGYIKGLEDGKSKQARYGMIGPTLARLHHLSKKALRGK